ncbi:hypothetical protein EVAR_27584_1 [Eumeta japonica]|uniref:Uncharacterized protein n=1 Tax=Eumeta variegata TaxID=151549 RepID=A0A4C1WDI1_EUMVA|nr:hypothetical protein EVAR_27584_1 [Eumeta japonica]
MCLCQTNKVVGGATSAGAGGRRVRPTWLRLRVIKLSAPVRARGPDAPRFLISIAARAPTAADLLFHNAHAYNIGVLLPCRDRRCTTPTTPTRRSRYSNLSMVPNTQIEDGKYYQPICTYNRLIAVLQLRFKRYVELTH